MRIIKIIIILFITSLSVYSQEQPVENTKVDYFTYLQNDMYSGKATIIQNDKIKLVFNKHIEYNEKLHTCHGYRIRIFSDSGNTAKASANKTKSDFLKLFPDMNSYLKYDQPNWKILVGDFRTKSDALKFLKLISESFPSAFIVKDMIEFPELD